MRAAQQEVTVELAQGRPAQVIWGERRLRVGEVIDEWRYGGRWWLAEPPRTCYLVALGALTAELHHEDRLLGRWWLARIQD